MTMTKYDYKTFKTKSTEIVSTLQDPPSEV